MRRRSPASDLSGLERGGNAVRFTRHVTCNTSRSDELCADSPGTREYHVKQLKI